jgi:hypothetical protein
MIDPRTAMINAVMTHRWGVIFDEQGHPILHPLARDLYAARLDETLKDLHRMTVQQLAYLKRDIEPVPVVDPPYDPLGFAKR